MPYFISYSLLAAQTMLLFQTIHFLITPDRTFTFTRTREIRTWPSWVSIIDIRSSYFSHTRLQRFASIHRFFDTQREKTNVGICDDHGLSNAEPKTTHKAHFCFVYFSEDFNNNTRNYDSRLFNKRETITQTSYIHRLWRVFVLYPHNFGLVCIRDMHVAAQQ